MILKANLSRIAVAVALAAGLSAPAMANDTTSNIRGIVTSTSGVVVPNAKIIVTDLRNGTSKVLSTNNTGTFSGRGLAVGGPYKIEVVDAVNGNKTIDNIFLKLGDTLNVPVQLETPEQQKEQMEKIAVTGAAISNSNYGGTGPATNFNLEDLQTSPAINRDIKDIVRVDPRIYVDQTNSGAIQCGGANPRFNSLTVDGVRMNDNFGLGSNGYPTTRMPFSYDAISQVAVELAPFDVKYGGFTACNINAVTKSGKSETTGSFFYDYTNDSMKGDKLEGSDVYVAPFSEKRFGVNVGGEIAKDKLYFFVAVEKLEGVDTFDRGYIGSGAASEVPFLNKDSYDRILAAAKSKYNYDPGVTPSSMPVEDEKLLAKLDWYINQQHRAAFTFNYNDGNTVREADRGNNNFEFSNHLYDSSTIFNSYVGQLMSDWTDEFSTEFRLGYAEADAYVVPLNGTDFGEVQISTSNTVNGRVSSGRVFLGADDSRHANKLTYDTTFMKLVGTYTLGDHIISGGFERESYDIFNLFVADSQGEYQFASVADFEAGIPSRITYRNAAGTNNVNDIAAEFGYDINTLYAQDQWYLVDYDLTLTYGLRYDFYTSSDMPRYNAKFESRYGFTNQQNIDGEGLVQPRLGFNWAASEDLEVRGGIGLYSGGNPNVWLSNNYTNDGVKSLEYRDNNTGRLSLFNMKFDGAGRPIFDIPQAGIDFIAKSTVDGPINTLDPNFKLPSEWKYALGATYTLPDDYIIMADVLLTKKQDAAIIKDLTRKVVGTAPDGRPIYGSAFGTRQEDYVLTNVDGDSGDQRTISVMLSKEYDFNLDWAFAYANNKAEDVNPMLSSVAFSNYSQPAVSDTENPGVARSNYDIPNRFTFKLGYKYEFVSGYETKFNLFASRNQGKPFSYTFSNNAPFGDYINSGRQLLYVPTGPDDSKVVFAANFPKEQFFEYLNKTGLSKYAGEIAPRNEFDGKWWTKVDLRVEQELPAFVADHEASAFFVIENIGNLLNDDWGVLYEPSFPSNFNVVNATIVNGKYSYNSFSAAEQSRVAQPSLWTMRVGVKYNF